MTPPDEIRRLLEEATVANVPYRDGYRLVGFVIRDDATPLHVYCDAVQAMRDTSLRTTPAVADDEVERVADAIFKAAHFGNRSLVDARNPGHWCDLARAAIAAIRGAE